MSDKLRDLLREARDELGGSFDADLTQLVERIDAALTEPAPEPVAEVEVTGATQPSTEITWLMPLHRLKGKHLLYAAPPPASPERRTGNSRLTAENLQERIAGAPASPSDARDAARYQLLRRQPVSIDFGKTVKSNEALDETLDVILNASDAELDAIIEKKP